MPNTLHVDDVQILKINQRTDKGNDTGRMNTYAEGEGYKPLYSISVATGTGSFITNTWEGE